MNNDENHPIIEALKNGKKIYLGKGKGKVIFELIRGKDIDNVFVQYNSSDKSYYHCSLDRFKKLYYFEFFRLNDHNDDNLNIVKNNSKKECEECNGKGVLDFVFYTRKCMKCG